MMLLTAGSVFVLQCTKHSKPYDGYYLVACGEHCVLFYLLTMSLLVESLEHFRTKSCSLISVRSRSV